MRHAFALLIAITLALPARAEMVPRAGWSVAKTNKSHDQLIDDVIAAAKANKMGIVTQAGPTGAAKSRGITIPGNRVIGLFNNIYAVEILNLSTAAMIEAPIRVYVTENPDGTATLSYKLPSTVFAPYMVEAGPELTRMAAELDAIFASIRDQAIR